MAKRYNIDPSLLRIITVILMIITGVLPFVIGYFIAWIIIPLQPGRQIIINSSLKDVYKNLILCFFYFLRILYLFIIDYILNTKKTDEKTLPLKV